MPAIGYSWQKRVINPSRARATDRGISWVKRVIVITIFGNFVPRPAARVREGFIARCKPFPSGHHPRAFMACFCQLHPMAGSLSPLAILALLSDFIGRLIIIRGRGPLAGSDRLKMADKSLAGFGRRLYDKVGKNCHKYPRVVATCREIKSVKRPIITSGLWLPAVGYSCQKHAMITSGLGLPAVG